jgi:hypothetical protein
MIFQRSPNSVEKVILASEKGKRDQSKETIVIIADKLELDG